MYVAIEGLIGSGKSTLSRWITEKLGWWLLPEPVEDNPILPLFYEDQKRWAFSMQIYMLHIRYRQQQVAGHSHIPCVLDRSLPGDRCFAKLQTKYGNMHEMEWRVYEDCYRSMSMVKPPFLMLYLDTSPEVAFNRIKNRARSVESGISLEYLVDLNTEYESLIKEIESGQHAWSRGISVLRVPWNDHHPDLNHSPAVDLLSILRKTVRG